jgi:aminoacrylate hydrolase
MPKIVAHDGVMLHYDRRGAGAPVVLIPGLGGDGRFWSGVADRLEPRFDLIIVDHRGAGRSDRPPGGYSIDGIAEDVLEVMDHAGVAAAHLVGHSTGGAIVQTLALDAPGRALTLVISGSWERPDARFRALFQARLALIEAGLAGPYQMLAHVLGHDVPWPDAREAELAAAIASAPQTLAPMEVTAARIRMLFGFDRSAELGAISHPTLVIGAVDDAMIPFHHAECLARLIPGARLLSVKGGHLYPRSDPATFAEAVASFIGPTAA